MLDSFAPAISGGAALAERLAALGLPPDVLRVALVAPAFLFLPGYALAGLGRVRRDGASTLTLSIALSLAVCSPLGFLLAALGRLDAAGWAAALSLLTGIAWLLGLVGRGSSARPWPKPSVGGMVRTLCFGGAIAIGALAIMTARDGALAQRKFDFTEFWMVPAGATDRNVVTVGVANHEAADSDFELDLLLDGALIGRLPPFRLSVGASRTFRFATASPPGRPGRIEAWLYRNGDRGTIYRKVWVSAAAPGATGAEED